MEETRAEDTTQQAARNGAPVAAAADPASAPLTDAQSTADASAATSEKEDGDATGLTHLDDSTASKKDDADEDANGDAEMKDAENAGQKETAALPERTGEPVGPEFYAQLKTGDAVDMFCVRTKKWLAAKIEDVGEDGFVVHYMGWNKKQDEVITKESFVRIAPRASEAAQAWVEYDVRLERRKRGREASGGATGESEAKRLNSIGFAESTAEAELVSTFVAVGATRSGRKITKRLVNDAAPKRSPTTPAAVGKKKTASPPPPTVLEDDLCAACGQIEDEELSDMILCDGGCLTSYHFSCLGIESAPEGKKWLCEQCRTNEQKCFMCGRNGTIGEKGGVFRCGAPSCGKFYHQSCINSNPLSKRFKRPKDGTIDEELLEFDAPFRCPRHACAVCENRKKVSDYMCCIKCPAAYHPHCVPPSARYNSVGLLCSKHPNDKLPRIPAFYFDDPDTDAVVVDLNQFPVLFVPKTEPDVNDRDDCHHFRLPRNVIDDVLSQAPPYRKLTKNVYTFKPPKVSGLEDSPECACKSYCGDDCINRLSFTECFGPAPTPGMKFTKQNKESNCMLGEECGNRALHQKMYPGFEKFHTQEKGWGLRVTEPVKAGRLVIEYVGEVINEEEKERRLQDHAKNTPEDKNMYIMELEKGVYIDARFKGSVSRYINHSCDPNCHLLKWRVKGVNRIAITALKDIKAGEELSYDYQFHTKQAMEWKCHCKSKNCRGTMAPEKINHGTGEPQRKLTKKELKEKEKRAMKQEKIQQNKEVKSTARRLSLTAQVSGIGDAHMGSKAIVRTGPAPRELMWVKQNHLFLARNATRGFDFLKRKELKDAKIVHKVAAPGTTKVKKEAANGTNGTRVLSPASTDTETASPSKVSASNGAAKKEE
ncbi:Histone-lysine n-methyltransferase, partial [Globisporangium splendens]